MKTLTQSQFIQAFEGKNTRVPVWFMRQAGRYLPEYQALKKEHTLDQMFKTPSLASEITLMPIDILNVDAAILFADILTLPMAMGVDIEFSNTLGPVINRSFDLTDLDESKLNHVKETIFLVKEKLDDSTALIGFAGSPFTVLTYLIEGKSTLNFKKTLRFIYESPNEYHQIMTQLTKNTISYAHLQEEAGIDAFQLFDTWAGILKPDDYAKYVLPYVQIIFENLNVPNIYFLKNSQYLLNMMDCSNADFLSVDHTVTLGDPNTLNATKKGVQGNLFNGLLYADNETLISEVQNILKGGSAHQKFIFNLSHGVLPDMDVEKLKLIVQHVHNFKIAS